MIVLGIDSSTDRLAIGLTDSSGILAEKTLDASREHASRIIGLIEEVLSLASLSRDRIEGVATAIGPGSFTGLRIGLAVTKGMALALKIPIVGVSTFEVLARRLENTYDEFFLSAVARKGEYYLCRVKPGGDIRAAIGLVDENDLADKIGNIPAGLVGREPFGVWEQLPNPIAKDKLIVSGGELALYGAIELTAGRSDDAAALEPLYIAPSQAERKFGQN